VGRVFVFIPGLVAGGGFVVLFGVGRLVDEGGSLVVKCPKAGFVGLFGDVFGVALEKPLVPGVGRAYRFLGVVGFVDVFVK
jgi:hypothetical protein